LIAFLGGTIGNLLPQERIRLLAVLADQMSAGDFLLLGADLVKDPDRLVAAYADSAGITAAFNRNMLHVLRRELGAEVDPEAFDHLAVWDPDQEWIEMRLRSARDQVVRVLDLGVPFPTGAELRTEISAKFRPSGSPRSCGQTACTPPGGGPTQQATTPSSLPPRPPPTVSQDTGHDE
jgi:L-histidine N-alpha-methyltransferase